MTIPRRLIEEAMAMSDTPEEADEMMRWIEEHLDAILEPPAEQSDD